MAGGDAGEAGGDEPGTGIVETRQATTVIDSKGGRHEFTLAPYEWRWAKI